MSSKRVYEFAKENKLSSKEVLEVAQDNGIELSSHMAMIDQNDQDKVLKAVKNKKDNKKPDKPANKKAKGKGESESKKDNKKSDKKKPQPKKDDKKNKDKDNQSGRSGGRRGRRRRGRGRQGGQNSSKPATPRKHKDLPDKLVYTEGMNIQEISKIIHRDTSEIIMKLMGLGIMANQNQALSKDVIELIALEYGIEAEEKEVIDISDLDIYFEITDEDKEKAVQRPPVVTIMGHVDHGKTTLLDTIRDASVTSGEAGGITQHIGAYQIMLNDRPITFLDTPGHEAFTTMRARGADITDIAIIVVAADDGVMPQTVEAINHAKAADVPIIVAVNKIDKPEANPDRVMQELTEYDIIPEAWGGDNIFVEISALQGLNIDELLEMVLLVADIQELKANPDRRAIGSVIEARLDPTQGATATLLVQGGTMHVGDPIVVGNTYGRVRTMVNDQGRRIQEAGPSKPVEITGLNDAPLAGDLFAVFEDEKTARHVGETRQTRAQDAQRAGGQKVTLDNLFETLQEGELRHVNVIIKGDVQGSIEALASSLEKIDVEGVKVSIVHKAVGAVTESDVSLASASGAIIIGFNVRPTPQARDAAKEEEVDIRTYRVIYDAIEEVEQAMKGMLDPEFKEQVTGQAVVRETYTVSKLGTIAGSYVTDGVIRRTSQARLLRDNVVIYEGEISSLKRFQDDAREVTNGYECGIMLENFNDIKIDDVIEAFEMVEVERD